VEKRSGKTGERYKILIIDDNPTILHILISALKGDYDTSFSKSGEMGLKLARETMPDLILLDLVMPDCSGFDVLSALKADEATRDIAVILISGNDSEEEKGYALGAMDYIRKPFTLPVVKHRVSFSLQFAEMKRALGW